MSAVEIESLRRAIFRSLGYASLGIALIATPASRVAAHERMAAAWQEQAQAQAPDQEQADDFAQDSQSQEDQDQAKRDREQEQRDREQEKRDREQEKRDREQEERERQQELYERGREALDEDRYDRAASSFDELAKRNGPQTDAALYWEAYAENRQGKRDAALATLADLKHRFPQSRWQKDASALEIEVRQRSGQAPRPDSQDDEDLKMLAIQGLMNSDPDRALPLLEKVLNGTGTPKEKSKALFVIAQSGSPDPRPYRKRPEQSRSATQSGRIPGTVWRCGFAQDSR
jgi:hypothetical protein